MRDHLLFDLIELRLDRRLDGLDAGVQLLGRDLQPLALRMEHGQQLAPARDQGREPLLALIGQGAQEALQIVAAQQHRCQLGQRARIHRVGLGQASHGFGEVARLARVDVRHGQACGLQGTR